MLLQLLSSIAEVEIPLSPAKAIQAKYLPSLVQFLCTTGRNIVKPAGPISNGMIHDKVTYVRKWKNRDREAQPVANLLDSEDTYQVKNYFMNHPVYFGIEKKDLFVQASQSQADLYYKKVEGIFVVHLKWQQNYNNWEYFDLLVYGRIPINDCNLYRYVYKLNQGKYDLLFVAAGSYCLPLTQEEVSQNQGEKVISFIFDNVDDLPYRYNNLFSKQLLSKGVFAVRDVLQKIEDYNKNDPLHLGKWGMNYAIAAQGKQIYHIDGDYMVERRSRPGTRKLKSICTFHEVRDLERQASDIWVLMDLLQNEYFNLI